MKDGCHIKNVNDLCEIEKSEFAKKANIVKKD